MNRRKRLAAFAGVLAVTFSAGLLTASAATPNATDCRKVAGISASASPGSVSSGQAFKYDECRFDKLDAAVKELGATTPAPSPSPNASSAPSTTPSVTPTATPTPSSTPTTAPASACTKPVVTFSGQGSAGLGQYGFPEYDASAELWGVNGYNYAQTMRVCSNDSWNVDVTTDNSKGDGAVKAYPSMRRIYHDWSTTDFSKDPRLSSFPRLDVQFGSVDPGSCSGCIYNTAFDIWLNGIGGSNNTELMIWTHNFNQRPYGTKVASGVQLDGHTWDLWSGNNNHYIAYVPTDTDYIKSGTVDVKAFVGELKQRGRIADSPLGQAGKDDPYVSQISYGVEAVSTNSVKKSWEFTKFTVLDK